MKSINYINTICVIITVLVVVADSPQVMAHNHILGGGSFENPLGSNSLTVSDVLFSIIQWVLGLSAFLALLALIVGGIRMIISFGNDRGVADAKQNIQWAIIGLVVIMLSYAIIRWVSNVIGAGL